MLNVALSRRVAKVRQAAAIAGMPPLTRLQFVKVVEAAADFAHLPAQYRALIEAAEVEQGVDFANPYHGPDGKFTDKAGAVGPVLGPQAGPPRTSGNASAFAQAAQAGNEAKSTYLGGGQCFAQLIEYKDDGRGVWKASDSSVDEETKHAYHDGNMEVAAYRLSELLGMQVVPETVYAEHGGTLGTSQAFIEGYTPGNQFPPLKRDQADRIRDIVALDAIIVNYDRKSANWVVDTVATVYAVDHGHAGGEYGNPSVNYDIMWGHNLYRQAQAAGIFQGGADPWRPHGRGRMQLAPGRAEQWAAITPKQFKAAFAGVTTGHHVDLRKVWTNLQRIIAADAVEWDFDYEVGQ